MTAVTPETVTEQTSEPRPGTLAHRLVALLVRLRTTAGEDFQSTMAHALDEAFQALAREYRR